MITKLRIRIIYVTKLWNNYMMIISIINKNSKKMKYLYLYRQKYVWYNYVHTSMISNRNR